MDRETFAIRQAKMTSQWYEGVRAREGDVNSYIERRHDAYLDRWKEAIRFMPTGARVLDVGGGNLFPRLLTLLKSLDFDYHYRDVDPSAVAGSKRLAEEFGFNPEKLSEGFNDRFEFESNSFDCIFSSHCVEHSFDLHSTLSEFNRMLVPGGQLLVAIPLGWEENPEHPYFFTPDQWISLLEDAGFEIRVAQTGREYPEQGCDLFLAARKVGECAPQFRLDTAVHTKQSYEFVRFDDPSIKYTGSAQPAAGESGMHLRGADWRIEISPKKPWRYMLPVFVNHQWSAKVLLESEGVRSFHDLFSWFHYVQPCIHDGLQLMQGDCTVVPVGRNDASKSTEGVLLGYMFK
ncbi:class I SAM-dependent methyltransferase [Variovorax sp. OV329]|uniref:class I SAM-dependent methyltransferase n=1 Tax=Variovorax sp. OV329 TaxID=1882825 RepID=UPI0008E5C99E|nr:class I SAM-dependent methyltransferase [Variovorax sp. OV329]SFN07239.1 Methyltransferase domain-containing protein [Variovorax sp. OV329]